jgi:hypothetical protein
MSEQLSHAVMSAKMEAIAELTASLESEHKNRVTSLKQSHDEERQVLEHKHAAEIEELKSTSQFALDELRSEESTKLASEVEKVCQELQAQLSQSSDKRINELQAAHQSELEHCASKSRMKSRGNQSNSMLLR